jgi:NADH-quinone oxidoreductase subunit N
MLSITIDALSKKNSSTYLFSILSLLGTGGLVLYNLLSGTPPLNENCIISKVLEFGNIPLIFDLIFIIGAILTIYASKDYFQRKKSFTAEFPSIILMTVFGMMFTAHSNNLLSLFIGIEIVSINFYILTSYLKKNISAIEAGVKYFILGSFAAAFLLMGISYLYGATEAINISSVSNAIMNDANLTFVSIGFAMLLIGLFFKTAVMPFHQWAADVYTGAASPITGFMSTSGKAVGIAAIYVVFSKLIPLENISENLVEYFDKFKLIIAIAASLTMIAGNIIALAQKSIKRMLAYSSISHAGYILMGLAAFTETGMQAMVFYTFVYLFMQIGAFILISGLENDKGSLITREDLTGLAKKSPIWAALFASFMFALSGLPPFSGFIAKYYLFMSAIQADMLWLTIIAIISSLISIYYYISTMIYMYFNSKENNLELHTKNIYLPAMLSLIITLILGVYPSLILTFL